MLLVALPATKPLAPYASGAGLLFAALVGLFSKQSERALGTAAERRDKLRALLRTGFSLLGDGDEFLQVREIMDPHRVGVKRAIPGKPDEGTQPAYQPRAFDKRLDEALKKGGLVIVHGPSAAGKSRAAYEAVRRSLPRRYFVRPSSLAALNDTLALGQEFREAVIWLDDFNPSIDQSVADVYGLVQRLLPVRRTDVTVVMTMWDETWAQSWAQALRPMATEIEVTRTLTSTERTQALADGRDSRVASALAQNELGLAEYIVGGNLALARWQQGRNVDLRAPSVGAAIVSAAVDCWRAGLIRPIPVDTLRRLYPHYLNPTLANHPELASFDDGLAWATTLIAGASTCLIKEKSESYRPFDYLVDRSRSDPDAAEIPAATYDEVAMLLDEGVGVEVAAAALAADRLDLAERAAHLGLEVQRPGGRATAMLLLAHIAERQGKTDEAEVWYDSAADAGQPEALQRRASRREAEYGTAAAEPALAEARSARRTEQTYQAFLARPRSLDPLDLGFLPRRPVDWLAPLVLVQQAVANVLTTLLGAFLDRRELQSALPNTVHHHDVTATGELWLDYVSGLGDGFNATYSVAWLLSQAHLTVDGTRLPRGEVLVMGGDEVYPVPSRQAYADRCVGPYSTALPVPPPDAPQPTLYALPGTSDSIDGGAAFLRTFAGGDAIGGYLTAQSRSYFALRLPQHWWLLAIDTAGGGDIDLPQRRYFQHASQYFRPEDRIILCLAEPTWVRAVTDPQAYDATDEFVRSIVAPTGARVPLMIGGGDHHYARYAGPDRELITCGGGGSYLSGTHHLPPGLDAPPTGTLDRRTSPSRRYALAATYPDQTGSRRHSWGVFGRLPLRNPGFATLLATMHTLLMLAMGATIANAGDIQRLLTVPLAFLLLAMLAGAVWFAAPPNVTNRRYLRHWILGLLHGMAHIGLAALGTWIWTATPPSDWTWPLPLAAATVVYAPIAGFIATQVAAAYLLTASAVGVNVKELFAGQGIEDGRSFLRLHVSADGALAVYPIAVDRICRRWQATPEGAPHESWLQPAHTMSVRLTEPPLHLR